MADVSPSAALLLRKGQLKREKRVLLAQKKLRDADLKICSERFNSVILCHYL